MSAWNGVYEPAVESPDDDDDAEAEADALCGRQPDGGCALAGTEHCDWDCPFS